VPQSLAQILVHVVFSTKNREPALADAVHTELHAYIGGIIAHHHGTLLKAGSVSDHMHLLIAHPRTSAPAELIQDIKTGSSKWIKSRGARYNQFHWQAGYGIFSVSASHRPDIASYFENQAEHHRRVSFQDEYRTMLRQYGIEYDERYVWD
jgi:putative transposase